MSYCFNPNNELFATTLNSIIYIDKSMQLAFLNSVIQTQQKYICVCRPRRFGKSITASMLAAYYSIGCDSSGMFNGLKISEDPEYAKHLNQYNLIYLNMQDFLSETNNVDGMIDLVTNDICSEIEEHYPQYTEQRLIKLFREIHKSSGKPFVFIIDEWDCVFRVLQSDKTGQKKYLDFLRLILKDKEYVALAYITGILPIRKFGIHSELNMFNEFTMTGPRQMAPYVGFTQEEVEVLCKNNNMVYEEMSAWYDGYHYTDSASVYNPNSVVMAILSSCYNNYWNMSESYEALKVYIEMNFYGLKDSIIQLLAGDKVKISVTGYSNDMVTFSSSDDIMTLLIHLGYLGYDTNTSEVFIPNKEITDEFITAVRGAGWNEVYDALKISNELLQATWSGDAKVVAGLFDSAHMDTSIFSYNSENALSYVVSLAYYSAREFYTVTREMPAGYGYADLVFLPRGNHIDKPAMIIELKWGQSATGSINQIIGKKYVRALSGYKGNLLLVGINYSKKTKCHECVIKTVSCDHGLRA